MYTYCTMPNPRKPRPLCFRVDCPNETKRPGDKFCSQTCQFEHQYAQYINAWLAGTIDGSKWVVEVSGYVRRYIKRTRGERCEICGWAERNPHTNTIPLQLDHIDGNWSNNRPENLRLLCPNHHALTATMVRRIADTAGRMSFRNDRQAGEQATDIRVAD